jgi:hypothetical protein
MDFKLPAMHKDTKPFCLGALVGALLIAWVGFDLFGWKTGGASETLAKRQADGAVVAAHARICSARFNSAGNLPVRLAELQKTERWSRGQVVAKAGFATMLGEKEPTQGVSEACANLLIPEKP